MKVKDYKNWKKIFMGGRTILKSDMVLFSGEQREMLANLEVITTDGKTLFVKEANFAD